MTEIIHLRSEGVSLVLAPSGASGVFIAHWGGDLGDLDQAQLRAMVAAREPGVSHSALDAPKWPSLLADPAAGFTGRPALEGWRTSGTGLVAPRLGHWSLGLEGERAVVARGFDDEAGWTVAVRLELTDGGLLRMSTEVTNAGDTDLMLAAVRNALPVGVHATELLDLTGRWTKERTPQRFPWVQGAHVRDSRHGRTGHDASLVMVAGEPGFAFNHGELWGIHVAWSGDHSAYAERTPEGDCLLGGGELIHPGEVVLAPGESYRSPWLLGSYSATGLDRMSHRFHDWLRSVSPRTRSPRPIVVNTWEAAYFEHDLDRLGALAEAAGAVGAERFVLDDGWFLGRRHDEAGLGDWQVDRAVWPDGLHPLIAKVHEHGMDFGLWVEPEMVNVDSELVREHPDWVLRGRADLPAEWRHQQVLDLQVPGAYAHIRDSLLGLLAEYPIAYLKWDHNRDLIDAAHGGASAVGGQTRAFYRLLDELHAAHPDLEIESCASGGGRVDAEVLTRTDRIWPSDTIDALERQSLQRWTSLLVPPELIGSHIGGPVAHTTGRSHRLGYRAATALLYHLGIEWDLTSLDDPEQAAMRQWLDLHRRIQPLVPTARLVHGDHPDPAVVVTGLVAADGAEAWYVVATVAAAATQHPAPVRLPGLDPRAAYRITHETPAWDQHAAHLRAGWWDRDAGDRDGLVLPGSVLAGPGLMLPPLAPETARVVHLVRLDGA